MGLEKMIKKEMAITVATVVLVSALFIVFSYSVFKLDDSSSPDEIMYGDISFSVCADDTCAEKVNNVSSSIGKKIIGETTTYTPLYKHYIPRNTSDYRDINKYVFMLKNKGSEALKIKIILKEDDTYSDVEKYNNRTSETSEFASSEEVMFAIGQHGVLPTIVKYSDCDIDAATKGRIIASSIVLNPNESKVFYLYDWLYIEPDSSMQDLTGKYFTAEIIVKNETL